MQKYGRLMGLSYDRAFKIAELASFGKYFDRLTQFKEASLTKTGLISKILTVFKLN